MPRVLSGGSDDLNEPFDLGKRQPLTTRNGRQAVFPRLGEPYGEDMDAVGSTSMDRRCLYAGCTTSLSIYNSDVLCWTHADEKTRSQFDLVTRTMSRPLIYRQRTESSG